MAMTDNGGRSGRVLIVDDEPNICALLSATLRLTGFDVKIESWMGVAVPKSTPAPIVKRLEDSMLKAMQDNGDDIFLVDVREINEYEIVSIPGATLIPKGEFLNGSALEKLPQDKRIVLHCKSGARRHKGVAARIQIAEIPSQRAIFRSWHRHLFCLPVRQSDPGTLA